MTGFAFVPVPGAAVITGRMSSLSLRYVCIASPIWRRLLMSFVAFARSITPEETETASAPRMMMIAVTTSNSISVKAREQFLVIQLLVKKATILVSIGKGKQNQKFMAEDCLTKHFQVCVRSPCPTQLIRAKRRHRHQVRNPSPSEHPHRPVYRRTWLPPSPVFH